MKNCNRNMFKIVCSLALGVLSAGEIIASIDSVSSLSLVSEAPRNNPGYLGNKQAITLMGMTNFTKMLRGSSGYHTNYSINYEIARKATMSYQFAYKGIHSTIEQADWNAYDVYVRVPGGGWNYSEYWPVGTMEIQYKEFSLGVKNYLAAFGSTAPYGVYTLANLNLGLAKCTSSDMSWQLKSGGSQALPSYDLSAVKGSLISMSYGFGSRRVIMDKVGLVAELTSGFTLKNSGGFSVYTQDDYSENYHGVDPADAMRRVMLREFHKSQWFQLKLGLGYLF